MEAERKQVTILFTDMVGFTAFSEKAGEEAAFTLMRSLSALMDEAVTEQGGVVQSFTGDGIMAVFGAPVAFEDAPLRACRAALSIQRKLKANGGDLEIKHGVRPQLRIAVNTGVAVVGKVQGGTDVGGTVLGDTVNFAARLQALAEPDSILMSEATYRLVQGMVEASFAGEHSVKGKAQAQKVFCLDGLRHGATRFEAAMSRGLSAFVGREDELVVLERSLQEAQTELRVIDIEAEPGMGKSRLVHEFRQRIGKERAFVLSGSCSSDGQQTPFLPFIEVVRGSFRLSAGELEKDTAQKLEMGLTSLGSHSPRHLSLLLHLLGLKVPEGALVGLDGVLIGLRTRELLQELLEARCKLSPVLMVIEDLHWIDSGSEELLDRILRNESKLPLLLVYTRRREYVPPWLDRRTGIAKLHLQPLPSGDIRRLIQGRLGAETLPEALARKVTEKAEGNPLFAEEIVSFLTERGVLHAKNGKLDFGAVAASLPASVQGVLHARVDRLEPKDRALLQAASVIGRRFDAGLLKAAASETEDLGTRLDAIQKLDLIHLESRTGDYAFKHALVREALFQTLLTERRQMLHGKIAEEIERRSGNRLAEVAEVLAHHYSQTTNSHKAFAYLSMAGSKSLGVYSLDEAMNYLVSALALLDKNPDCASDEAVAEFFVSYTLLLSLSLRPGEMINALQRYLVRIGQLGDDARTVRIRHHFVFALLWNARYSDAVAEQRATSEMASRLGDSRAKAYSLAGEIYVSTIADVPKPLHEFVILKRDILAAASETNDAYIQCWARFVIVWEEIYRGRMNEAREAARDLMQVGRQLNDPRTTGFGLAALTWIALTSDSYAEALECCDQSLMLTLAPFEQINATRAKGWALVLLRRIEEGIKLLEEDRHRCIADGNLYAVNASFPIFGLYQVLSANIAGGIRLIEEGIVSHENVGCRVMADWSRFYVSEVYLQIIGGNEKLPFFALVKNLPIITRVMLTAAARIPALMAPVLSNPHFDNAGLHVGRAQMILGLLYKLKRKRPQAVQHLVEAKRILSQFGQTPILARVDAALAELGQ
jgi:class 3 adenylate cyclase